MAAKETENVEETEQIQDEQENVEKTEEEKREDRRGWIRFILVHVAVLVPLAVGFACLIGGTNHNNHTVAFAGKIILEAVVPSVMFILVVSILMWKYVICPRRKTDTKATTDETTEANETQASAEPNEQIPSQREREQNMLNAINSTSGYASRAKLAEYESDHVAEGMKHAPTWGIVLGLTCFFSLFALLIVATVLLIKRIFVGAIVCAAIVGVVLITTLIVMIVSRAKATNGDISKAKKITEGKVKACFMVGMAETRTRHGHGETVRVQGVTYQVIVVAEEIEYRAFSKQFYETDKNVTIAVMGKKRAKIVENTEPEKTDE